MIRRLSHSDVSNLQTLLQTSAHFNVYMQGNLNTLGIEHEYSEFWGDYAEAEPAFLRGVVNRYMTGWSVFGHADTNWAALANVIDTYPATATRLQDNPGGIPSLLPFLRRYDDARLEEEHLMTLRRTDFRPVPASPDIIVRPAHIDDLDALITLYATAGSMQRSQAAIERPLRDGYFWVAEKEGAIRGTALTNAIGAGYAMIGGVYTAPAWRGYGLSQAVCSALCNALLDAQITPTLYWIAADAGHIYNKLGFKPVGTWRSVWLNRRTP